MASNFNQQANLENAPQDDSSQDTITNEQPPPPPQLSTDNLAAAAAAGQSIDGTRRGVGVGGGGNRATNQQQQHGFYHLASASNYKILNDAQLIRHRRTNFNQRAKKGLELMCEDKVSKYKLEEVHCSSPSSNKSTFIMTFSPDGQRVASTHGDHRIYICDLNTGKLLDTLEGHPKTPWCLAWHPSNREILASGCLAGEVRVWDLRSKACESWTSENNTIITSLDFHPKERILVIATSNDIHFWDWSESDPFAKTTTTHDKEKVKYVEFDSSGTKLITGISNLPKFAGYSSDSLQTRIIDSYLTQGTLDQLPTDNMTQNSEISSPLSGSLNSNGSFNDWNPSQLAADAAVAASITNNNNNNNSNTNNSRQSVSGTTNINANDQDINYRSTFTLSRVAFLYRQLEALENSMRHTHSFSPFITNATTTTTTTTTRPVNSPIDLPDGNSGSSQSNQQQQSDNLPSSQLSSSSSSNMNDNVTEQVINEETPPMAQQQATSQSRIDHSVVSFDASLENLHLTPLVIDGQTINPASVIEQYPIDLPHLSHYMMQLESINQVNQNYIRISKLMSSVKLYRQVVQQILSSNTGQGHYQPNQILTAQSASPRSSRHCSNSPIVFRNFGSTIESNALSRTNRPTDPILAIRFRNSARNVPLVTICKIDLLSARSVCIMRSQQLIEQAISGPRSTGANEQSSSSSSSTSNTETNEDGSGRRSSSNVNSLSSSSLSSPSPTTQANQNNSELETANANPSFYPLLNQLHQSLTVINHAPLTTSNVHTHISSLRSLVNKLLNILSSMLQTQDEGRRLISLIHDIAHSLTGRSWNIPLGATLDDIRLDVIHTLCIVDLTLHLARQVQLLQMQRLSATARIEESRRGSSSSSNSNVNSMEQGQTLNANSVESAQQTTTPPTTSVPMDLSEETARPSTSSASEDYNATTTAAALSSKRKESESLLIGDESAKRRKVERNSSNNNKTSSYEMSNINSETNMIEPKQTTSTVANPTPLLTTTNQQNSHNTTTTTTNNHNSPANQLPISHSNNLQNTISPDSNPVVVWNSTLNQGVEQSLQRFLVATANSLNNSHILVRIYHRLHGGGSGGGLTMSPGSSIVDHHSIERPNPPPQESRRRALSQDNSLASPPNAHESSNLSSGGSIADGSSIATNTSVRSSRQAAAHGGNHPLPGSSNGVALEAWQRHPHFHVYQTRGTGQHLWFNQWTIPLPMNNSNYRLQCWNFSLSTIPNIKDSQSNIVTQKCRIHNDASIDISSDGGLIACLVPRDDGSCIPSFDLKIFSLRSFDFGVCYYQLPHGPNAISVSLSPSAGYAVVGLASNKFISNDPNDDDLTIAKVFKLKDKLSSGHVRDIKIKRDDSALSLNAIRWMERGIVYNVGPQHHRVQATRLRNRVA